jgi:hypothetical protein
VDAPHARLVPAKAKQESSMKRALRRSSQQAHLVVIDLKSHEFADDVKQTLCGTVVDEMVAADFRVIYEEPEVRS